MVQKGYRRRHCTLWCLSAQSWTGSHLYEQLTLPASSGPEWASLCPCSMHLACLNQGGCGFSDLSCDWPLSALSSNFLRVLFFLQSIEQQRRADILSVPCSIGILPQSLRCSHLTAQNTECFLSPNIIPNGTWYTLVPVNLSWKKSVAAASLLSDHISH